MRNLGIESIKLNPSGDYLLFARVNGNLIKKRFSGYSVHEARRIFKAELKQAEQ